MVFVFLYKIALNPQYRNSPFLSPYIFNGLSGEKMLISLRTICILRSPVRATQIS